MLLRLAIFASASLVSAYSGSGVCTYHAYEEDQQRLGLTYDNSPPYCGMRYSSLDTSKIMAVENLPPELCNQCIEVTGKPGVVQYILAVDRKGAAGLDVAKTSFQALFPGEDPLNPQTCSWKLVDPSFCSGVCKGLREECMPGVKNMLAPYLLPPVTDANRYTVAGNPSAPLPLAEKPTQEKVEPEELEITPTPLAAPTESHVPQPETEKSNESLIPSHTVKPKPKNCSTTPTPGVREPRSEPTIQDKTTSSIVETTSDASSLSFLMSPLVIFLMVAFSVSV